MEYERSLICNLDKLKIMVYLNSELQVVINSLLSILKFLSLHFNAEL